MRGVSELLVSLAQKDCALAPDVTDRKQKSKEENMSEYDYGVLKSYQPNYHEARAFQVQLYREELQPHICMCHVQQLRLAHVHVGDGIKLVNNGDWVIVTGLGRGVMSDPEFRQRYRVP